MNHPTSTRTPGRNLIVIGLGFGDEGKGATVDHYAAQGRFTHVVRFSGGAQAAHNVRVHGQHHTFHQFGSGTLAGLPTYLTEHVLLEPAALEREADQLATLGVPDPLSTVTIHPDTLITTPIHVAANRTREDLRGNTRHGSCGLGVGETTWYALAAQAAAQSGQMIGNMAAPATVTGAPLRVRDCANPNVLRVKLDDMARFYAPLLAQGDHGHPDVDRMVSYLHAFSTMVTVSDQTHLADAAADGRLLFEGSQGVLLDEHAGFHPHTTWSTVTPVNAQAMLARLGVRPGTVVGVTRAYTTRHGAGPFPTEDPSLEPVTPEPDNREGRYQGEWRVGHLDLVTLRYAAVAAGGVDQVALTHVDTTSGAADRIQVVNAYKTPAGATITSLGAPGDLPRQERLTRTAGEVIPVKEGPVPSDRAELVELVEDAAGAPVTSIATGPDRTDRATHARTRVLTPHTEHLTERITKCRVGA